MIAIQRLLKTLPIIVLSIFASAARAETAAPPATDEAHAVGTVTHLAGVLTVRRAGASKILAVSSQIESGDTLITERNSYARIKFIDNAEIVLRPATQLEISNYVYDLQQPERNSVAIKLVDGGIRAVTGLIGKRNHDAVRFSVPTGEIQVLGTHFGALFCQNDCGGVPAASGQTPSNGLHVDVAQGAIVVSNLGGSQVFQAGQFGYVATGNAPPVLVPPARGVPLTIPLSISRNAPSSQATGAATMNACLVQ